MKLNAFMLYEALRTAADVALFGVPAQKRSLRFVYFYDGDPAHLLPGGVYVSPPELLPSAGTPRQDLLWVSWGSRPPEVLPGAPLLFFSGRPEPRILFNTLQQVFIRFCAWEEQLDDILAHGSNVQKMLELCEPLFDHPVCLVDSSLNYLAYTGSFLSRGETVFLTGDGAAALHRPLFYDPGLDRVAHLRNRDFDLGTLYLIHDDTPFSVTEAMVFDLLAEKLVLALQNLSMLSGLYQNSFRRHLETLFETKIPEEDRLYESLSQWGGRKGDTFICYKVKASHIQQKINAEYLCSIFENALYAAVAFWYDTVLVVLTDVSKSGCPEEKIHGQMTKLLQQLHLKGGVSLPFTDLGKAWYYYRQACCAFEEGYPGHPEETLYFFGSYVPEYLLHHAVGEFPTAFLLDLGLQRLVEHDSLYAVSYLDTLNAYFRCRMNMSQTAELLNIHRTSLNSRMQKIWECLDHEPTQEYLLYLQMILAILKHPR